MKKLSAEIAAEIIGRFETTEVREIVEATKNAADDASGTFEVAITTENLDRYQEVIKLDGWELDHYRNNPVVLWGHDHKLLPIGVATELFVQDGKLVARGKFAPHEQAQEIRRLYDLGIVRATSVGFIEKEREGNLITKAELLEFSFVSVPANPYALSLAMKSGVSVNEMVTKGIMFIEEKEAEPEEPQSPETEPIIDDQPTDEPDPSDQPAEETPACAECGDPADAEPSAQSEDHPICKSCLAKGWTPVGVLNVPAIVPLIDQLKATATALEAVVSNNEPERSEEEPTDEEERRYRDFSNKRRVVQEAATIIGDILAEKRKEMEEFNKQ